MPKTKRKTPAASLKRRNKLLGLPIHIKKVPILLNIGYYIILVLNKYYISFVKPYFDYLLFLLFNGECCSTLGSPAPSGAPGRGGARLGGDINLMGI